MALEEKATLTQRRAISSGAEKLDKSKMKRLGGDNKEGGGSAAKVVIWVVIVVVLAVAAYFGIRTFLNAGSNGDTDVAQTPTPTVQPTIDPTDLILGPEIFSDSEAAGKQKNKKYSSDDQTVGKASEAAFTVETLDVQQYESFIRVQFGITSDTEDVLIPETTVSLEAETNRLMFKMMNVLESNTELDYEQVAVIPSSIIDTVKHEAQNGTVDSFQITLDQTSTFVLHQLTESDTNYVVIDVKEVTPNVVEGGDTMPTPTVEPTEAEEATSSGDAEEYSKTSKSISTGTTGNSVTIDRYNYGDTPGYFNYNLFLTGPSGTFPNISATYSDTKITVVIKNLSNDKIVGNGGSGSTNFASQGVKDVSSVDISNSGNKSTYQFNLTSPTEYLFKIDEDNGIIRFEFKH
ncbi:MAG: hypothetical protein ACE5DX_05940 [Candidatus Dojkabacteria bacterium]